jgi:hypothetical protein
MRCAEATLAVKLGALFEKSILAARQRRDDGAIASPSRSTSPRSAAQRRAGARQMA